MSLKRSPFIRTRVAALCVMAAAGLCLSHASLLAEVQRFRLNPQESHIVTKVKDPFGNIVNGKLRIRQGEAAGDPDRLQETGSVNVLIDANTYNSNLGLRDQDVQEYYLEVQQHPTIRFSSSALVKVEQAVPSEASWQISLRGTLDLHGVKKEISFPVRLSYEGKKIIAQGRLQILLEDFKIAVPRLFFLKAGNQVEVEFNIVGEP